MKTINDKPETNYKPETNKFVIVVVVLTLAANATLGFVALAYCLLFSHDLNTALLAIFSNLVTYLLGVLSGMLVKTSPSEATPAVVKAAGGPGSPIPATTERPEGGPAPEEPHQFY